MCTGIQTALWSCRVILTLHVELHQSFPGSDVKAIVPGCLALIGAAHFSAHTLQAQLPIIRLHGHCSRRHGGLLIYPGPDDGRLGLPSNLTLQLSPGALPDSDGGLTLRDADGWWH